MNKNRIMKIVVAVIIAVLGMIGGCMNVDADTTVIPYFLACDNTDTHEYLSYYTCGHFSRDLAYNASQYNISIGSIILGNRLMLKGYQNHIMNYFIEDGQIWVIEPQNDRICKIEDTEYCYYRLYSDGTQVPSYWKVNLAYLVI